MLTLKVVRFRKDNREFILCCLCSLLTMDISCNLFTISLVISMICAYSVDFSAMEEDEMLKLNCRDNLEFVIQTSRARHDLLDKTLDAPWCPYFDNVRRDEAFMIKDMFVVFHNKTRDCSVFGNSKAVIKSSLYTSIFTAGPIYGYNLNLEFELVQDRKISDFGRFRFKFVGSINEYELQLHQLIDCRSALILDFSGECPFSCTKMANGALYYYIAGHRKTRFSIMFTALNLDNCDHAALAALISMCRLDSKIV